MSYVLQSKVGGDFKPHPEGGHFRETFRDSHTVGGRAASTAILFLLARGERSRLADFAAEVL